MTKSQETLQKINLISLNHNRRNQMLVDCGFTGLTKQGIKNQKSELDKLTFY